MRGAEHGAFGLWTRVVGQTTRPFLFRSPPKRPSSGPNFGSDPWTASWPP